MTYVLSDDTRSKAADGIADDVDAGAGAGYIEFRTGAPPATPATADSGTLLATTPFADPAFGAAAAGVVTANAITSDADVDDSGEPGHFRIKDSDGNVHSQGTVTITGGGGDITFDSVTWIAGGTVAMTSLTITVPAS